MRNLGNNLVANVYESNLPPNTSPARSNFPLRPQEGELNAQLRRTWVEAKWVRRAFVRSFVHPSITVWILDLYRSWLLQAHSRRASRPPNSPTLALPTASTITSLTNSKLLRTRQPRLIDRRRLSTVVRGSTARAQVTLGMFLSLYMT